MLATPPLPDAAAQTARPAARKAAAPPAKTVRMVVPTARPGVSAPAAAPAEPQLDLSRAVPARRLSNLPSSAEQLRVLDEKLKQQTPQVAAAREMSETLRAEAAALRKKLIATAAEISKLERLREEQTTQIAELAAEDARLSAGFVRDRVAVTRLIAVLQRLQHDMPPALALKPDDALAAARGAMLIGASLPPVYDRAAALSRRLDELAATRARLAASRVQADATEKSLTTARAELAVLLEQKESEAEAAAGTYGTLNRELAVIAAEAADFKTLMARIQRLRRAGAGQSGVVTVEARAGNASGPMGRGSLLTPVVGTLLPPGSGAGPGATFATLPRAQVIAPADAKVLFAGPYHKAGYVLILEVTTGYDLVLAGLGQVSVRPNDELLAGEPVGTMPGTAGDGRLYFEIRRDGKGLDPEPWLSLDLRKAKR